MDINSLITKTEDIFGASVAIEVSGNSTWLNIAIGKFIFTLEIFPGGAVGFTKLTLDEVHSFCHDEVFVDADKPVDLQIIEAIFEAVFVYHRQNTVVVSSIISYLGKSNLASQESPNTVSVLLSIATIIKNMSFPANQFTQLSRSGKMPDYSEPNLASSWKDYLEDLDNNQSYSTFEITTIMDIKNQIIDKIQQEFL